MFKDSPEGQTHYCPLCEVKAKELEGRDKIIASQREKLNKVREWGATIHSGKEQNELCQILNSIN